MDATMRTSLSIPKALCDDATLLAAHLNLPRNRLFVIAIEKLIGDYQRQGPPDGLGKSDQTGEKRSEINQGDIYWVLLGIPGVSEPSIRHPHVVIQDNVFNHSRLSTTVTCSITSNAQRAALPGNVLLEVGEGNLPRQSVVEVSKVSSVGKVELVEYIGSLTEPRIHQILAGMHFLQSSYAVR
ncbi:MAG TPA: type II toxin-antitoxin system PemK/MazF family toxin [Candidatus Limnocylindrales bacterium]|nr:type II toxin-antitoxin system PemK/MazF family toxin [Candidatus Limnocylindrales bacterium]